MLDDPEVALMIARKTAEAVCKIVFHDKVSQNGIPTGLDVLIQQLNKATDLPKKLNLHLLNIQQHGNFGSHDQGDESDEIDADFVAHCITSLDYVCKWLQSDYLGAEYQSSSTPAPTSPPEAHEKLIHLKPPITVKDLASAIGLKPFVIIKNLMDIGVFLNQNGIVTPELAARLLEMHGWSFEKETRTKASGLRKDPASFFREGKI